MSALDDEIADVIGDWRFEKCPRCRGPLRGFVFDRGAWSRAADVTVCGRCGSDEAVRQAVTNEMIPVTDWPVLTGAHHYAH